MNCFICKRKINGDIFSTEPLVLKEKCCSECYSRVLEYRFMKYELKKKLLDKKVVNTQNDFIYHANNISWEFIPSTLYPYEICSSEDMVVRELIKYVYLWGEDTQLHDLPFRQCFMPDGHKYYILDRWRDEMKIYRNWDILDKKGKINYEETMKRRKNEIRRYSKN